MIPITQNMRDFADAHDKRIRSRLDKKKKSYTGYATDRSFYFGTLGELVFLKWLQENGKRADYVPPADVVDDEDVLVYVLNKSINLDIKTASQSFHKMLILYPRQLALYGHKQCFVGIKLHNETEGEVLGYCYRFDLKPMKVGEDDRVGLLHHELRPIENMLKKLDNGELNIVLPYGNILDHNVLT